MKFAQKLTLGIVALLCATLSLGGAWTINRNFDESLHAVETQDTALHLRERYALENALAPAGSLIDITVAAASYDEGLRGAAGADRFDFSLLSDEGASIYSNMPSGVSYASQWAAVTAGEDKLWYHPAGEKRYLLLASPIQTGAQALWLVNAYDVSAAFAERDRQLRQYLLLEGTALVLAGAAAAVLSGVLTRPLRGLKNATRDIAAGAYDRRVTVATHDELADLAASFNTMAAAVETRVEALRQEADRQSRFVAAFTHELKTPMTAILGYADLLRGGEQPPERRQAAANYIYHESRRLEQLGRQLLALLGLQNDGVQLVPVPVAAVFGDVRRSLPQSFGATLETSCDPGAVVAADRPLLADLVRNLVLNAANAAPADGKVRLCCQKCGEGWEIAVADTGCGMDAAELAHITEPFYMVDKSRARAAGGNGLGLSLCAEIARLHHSELRFESAVGVGTTVRLTLPPLPSEPASQSGLEESA